MRFAMPYGGELEIRASQEIDEDEIGIDEEVEGVTYQVFWNEVPLPWNTNTRLAANAIAFGCQYGAYEMLKNSQSLRRIDQKTVQISNHGLTKMRA